VRFGNLSLTSVGLLVDVRVDNPYPLELPVLELDYSLSSSGTPFLSGKAPGQGGIPARSSKVVTVPVQVQTAELLRTVSGVRPGSVVPWRLAAGITIDPPSLAPIRLPLSTAGELLVPAAPRVAVKGIHWDKLALDGVRGTLSLELENTNSVPLTLSRLTYALDLAGTTVASAEQASSQQLAAGGRQTLELPLSFSPASAGLAMLQAMGRSSATYAMTGGLRVTTPFGNMDLPFETSGETALAH
jgi:LEA14-like dessication related protein